MTMFLNHKGDLETTYERVEQDNKRLRNKVQELEEKSERLRRKAVRLQNVIDRVVNNCGVTYGNPRSSRVRVDMREDDWEALTEAFNKGFLDDGT